MLSRLLRVSFAAIFFSSLLGLASIPVARAEVSNAKRMHDMLVTAGYTTIIGAALGGAWLVFTDKPSQKLIYIARGAAVGFVGGIGIGAAVSFAPLFWGDINEYGESTSTSSRFDYLPDPNLIGSRVVLSPIFSKEGLAHIAAQATLMKF